MKKILAAIFLIVVSACTIFNNADNVWVKNAYNENLYVQIDGLNNAPYHKLAFVQHGLASNMEHAVVQSAKKALLDKNYVVVSFDARYSLGNSGNDVTKVKLDTFAEDLETVVDWAKKQAFYHEPFALVGHSLGGASVIKYGAKHPEQVDILIPVTPVISGRSWEQSCMKNLSDFCRQWKQSGTYQYTDEKNHKTAVIPFSIITDCYDYDANLSASRISAKTLLIGAENDIIINNTELKKLAGLLNKGDIKIIKSSDHNFVDIQNQEDLSEALKNFIE